MIVFFIKLIWNRKAKVILNVIEPLFDSKNQSVISKLWVKLLMSKVDHLIAISELVKEDSKQFYSGPVSIAHHYVIDTDRFKNIKTSIKSKKLVFICERPDETG